MNKKGRGCPAAALRIWLAPDVMDQAPIELCGDKASTEVWHYVSAGQNARISFITTDKTIGAQVILLCSIIAYTYSIRIECVCA